MAEFILKKAAEVVKAVAKDVKSTQSADKSAPSKTTSSQSASGKSAHCKSVLSKLALGDSFVSKAGLKKTESFDAKTGGRTVTYIDPITNLPVKSSTSVPKAFDPVTNAPTEYVKTEDKLYQNGIIAERIEYNPDTGEKITYSYYVNGVITRTDKFFADKLYGVDTFDEKGKITVSDHYSNGELDSRMTYFPGTETVHEIIRFGSKEFPLSDAPPPILAMTAHYPDGSLDYTYAHLPGGGFTITERDPVTGYLTITTTDPSKGIKEVKVIDASGKVISDKITKI